MSHEKAPSRHELKNTVPNSAEIKGHHERLHSSLESSIEKTDSSKVEVEARHEVAEKALTTDEILSANSEKAQQTPPPAPTNTEKAKGFDTTMHHVRKNLAPTERVFSKIIHQPTIEKTSEVVGKTIARPSAVIGATLAGIIGLVILFGTAKFVGFELSGSELPLLLAGGLVSGLLIEWIYKSVRSLFLDK